MSTQWNENRPQRIVEQFAWRPYFTDTVINPLVATGWINVFPVHSDVLVEYVSIVNTVGTDLFDVRFHGDGDTVEITGSIAPGAILQYISYDADTSELIGAPAVTPVAIFGAAYFHSFSIDIARTSWTGAENLTVTVRYRQL